MAAKVLQSVIHALAMTGSSPTARGEANAPSARLFGFWKLEQDNRTQDYGAVQAACTLPWQPEIGKGESLLVWLVQHSPTIDSELLSVQLLSLSVAIE